MNHEALISRIPDLMAGNVRWWQRRALDRHIRGCAACQAELAGYQRLDRELQQAVPAYMARIQPSAQLMAGIHRSITAHPIPVRTRPAGLPGLARFAVPAVTAILAAIAIALAVTFSGGGEVSALYLETPVRGTFTFTQGGAPVSDGEFSYVSPELWERSTTNHRLPLSVRDISEVSIDGETLSRRGDGPWQPVGGTPADRQPIPGLGDLGMTEQLFDAVLNLYQLEETGHREFRGEQLTEFTGVDSGYAARTRDSSLASGSRPEEAEARFQFYAANPPAVTVLADEQERIRAILVTVPLMDVPDPGLIEVVITEFNAPIEITSPLR